MTTNYLSESQSLLAPAPCLGFRFFTHDDLFALRGTNLGRHGFWVFGQLEDRSRHAS